MQFKPPNAIQAADGVDFWGGLRGRLILLALIGFLPLFGLAVFRAIEARHQALAEARTTVVRMTTDAE